MKMPILGWPWEEVRKMSYWSYFPLVDPLSVPIFLPHNTLYPRKSEELTWPLWSCLAAGWERCSPLGGEVLSYHLAAAAPQIVSSILWLLASQKRGKDQKIRCLGSKWHWNYLVQLLHRTSQSEVTCPRRIGNSRAKTPTYPISLYYTMLCVISHSGFNSVDHHNLRPTTSPHGCRIASQIYWKFP